MKTMTSEQLATACGGWLERIEPLPEPAPGTSLTSMTCKQAFVEFPGDRRKQANFCNRPLYDSMWNPNRAKPGDASLGTAYQPR